MPIAGMARTSGFSKALADKICESIIDGMTLRQIGDLEGMPTKTTILRWLGDDRYIAFRDQYARARELQSESMADDILEISDDGRNDWMEIVGKDGDTVGWRVNGEAVQRSKLRVETRKWLMSKMLPKKYGAIKIDSDGGGEGGPGLDDPNPDV
ncbi:terminase small subunit-like protein [Paraburkholderia acidisoli]|uniref:Terminase small subunit protein n=1 Tax=Paraburkholderia acidisoli TaxID=2571748 RepID=A0A7Z2JKJ9_9BURK|nr:terminase small subunit protein [Paraburkholderia acidisoli]QGZ66285.1 terminase small subunit protein [Paraburkholderia acidisoli]QGZ66369.1 terminase small subunit protein [Paraburkholderia acidisoli]